MHRRGIIIHPEELNQTWIDRVLAAKLNVLGLHPVGGAMAHETLELAIQRHGLPAFQRLLTQANRRGVQVEYEMHVMAWLLPRGLFADVPEWFRMDEEGRRVADFNLCPSNADALAYVAARAASLAGLLDTGSCRYFYWTDDVKGYACHCDHCKELTPSDQQMLSTNAILRGLRRYNPAARMAYLAYHDAMDAPTSVLPLDGIFLEYAPIGRDSHRPLFDPECPQNASETRSLRALIELFGIQDAQVLEYWVDNSRFSKWKKPPKPLTLDEPVMRADVAQLTALGFEAMTSFGCYLGEDYEALHGVPPVQAYGDILKEALP